MEQKLNISEEFNIEEIREKFPIFNNNPNLIYLDSAATSQKPETVINAQSDFLKNFNSNVHRGIYKLSIKSTELFEKSRNNIAKFINAKSQEIVFTKNTTESINIIANSILDIVDNNKTEIVITEMEHHSNLIPWQQLAKKNNMKLIVIPITNDYKLDYDEAKNLINDKTAIVTLCHVSNSLGTINNIAEIISYAKEFDALTVIDGAQAVSHFKVDVKELDCDFYVFSGHKMYGPDGVGILYGKEEFLNKMNPTTYGGGMINTVSFDETTFADLPEKFEAGTQNISGIVALNNAIEFIEEIGFDKIKDHESELLRYTIDNLKSLELIEIYNPGVDNSIGVISFNLDGIHAHDISTIVDEDNIALRAGHHCCIPLMKKLKLAATCRISLGIYNTKEEIDKLIESLNKAKEIFK